MPGVLLEQMGKVKAMAVAALGSVGRLVKVVPGQKNVYIYVPRAQMTSIFEGQPSKRRPFPIKIGVIGFQVCIYIYICTVYINYTKHLKDDI